MHLTLAGPQIQTVLGVGPCEALLEADRLAGPHALLVSATRGFGATPRSSAVGDSAGVGSFAKQRLPGPKTLVRAREPALQWNYCVLRLALVAAAQSVTPSAGQREGHTMIGITGTTSTPGRFAG